MLGKIIRVSAGLFRIIRNRIDLWGRDEFTMADYLRKQGVQIGENCRIFISDVGTEPYLIKIGNHCTITIGVQFIVHDGGCSLFRHEFPDLNYFGKIEIEDNCFIGVNAIILPNVKIGRNSIIGSGAVVAKDIPPGSVAVGVPARVISTAEEYKKKMLAEWEKLNLKGERRDWKPQLIRHFWGDSYDAEMKRWQP
jgi:acetyltransferase-like isoleucine patch superfamily enzyme